MQEILVDCDFDSLRGPFHAMVAFVCGPEFLVKSILALSFKS